MMAPDALAAIAYAIGREWGHYGYSVREIVPAVRGGAVAEVWSSDGGVFYVGSDRYGVTCHGSGWSWSQHRCWRRRWSP
jgi:hypothetical protein